MVKSNFSLGYCCLPLDLHQVNSKYTFKTTSAFSVLILFYNSHFLYMLTVLRCCLPRPTWCKSVHMFGIVLPNRPGLPHRWLGQKLLLQPTTQCYTITTVHNCYYARYKTKSVLLSARLLHCFKLGVILERYSPVEKFSLLYTCSNVQLRISSFSLLSHFPFNKLTICNYCQLDQRRSQRLTTIV